MSQQPGGDPVLDTAIGHFLQKHSEASMAQMVASGADLWGSLGMAERFQAGFIKREIGEVLASVNGLLVLASIQRTRPELAQVVGTDQGLLWLERQLRDLRTRFPG